LQLHIHSSTHTQFSQHSHSQQTSSHTQITKTTKIHPHNSKPKPPVGSR
jgi:hypothetical protein